MPRARTIVSWVNKVDAEQLYYTLIALKEVQQTSASRHIPEELIEQMAEQLAEQVAMLFEDLGD